MMSSGMSAADVAVLTGNAGNSRGCNDGFGGEGWGWIWLILIFAIFGGWGNGFGGFGGNGGGFNTPVLRSLSTRRKLRKNMVKQQIQGYLFNKSTKYGERRCA